MVYNPLRFLGLDEKVGLPGRARGGSLCLNLNGLAYFDTGAFTCSYTERVPHLWLDTGVSSSAKFLTPQG